MKDINYEEEIPLLIEKVNLELNNLNTKMCDSIKTQQVYHKQLIFRLDFLKWVNRKWNLRSEAMPNVVKQKEIFYCELGITIGSEQGLKRPVVVLQNNIGNSHGETVVVIPITTYENSVFYEKENKKYIKYSKGGKIIDRPLDFYEVTVIVTSTSKKQIVGIANVVHIREVSKKRLSKTPVAIITDDNYKDIFQSVIKNLEEF